jgi:ribosomal protein L12E/L44/L45/RPP1/RPP2
MANQQQQSKTKPKLVNVLEYASSDRPHKVDRENGVIHDVKILGLQSKNGPKYSPDAIKNGASQYDGAHIFVAHPERSRPDQERSPRDMIGWIEKPHVETDGLYGDLHYIKSHEMAGPLAEIAERRPDRIGLSHNAVVTESARGSDVVYESINRVRSVDLVCKPATTKGIFESEDPAMDETAAAEAAPAGGTASLTDMILAKVGEILKGDGDPGAKATAISKVVKELLKVEEKLDSAASAEPPKETPATESAKEKPAKIDADKALDVLESVGVTPNRVRIRALTRMESEAEAKALAETWKAPGATATPAKPRSGSVLESQQEKPEDSKARKERFESLDDIVFRR